MSLFDLARPNAYGYRDVSPADVEEAGATVRLVDVRELHEFNGELGHAAGAELVPLGTVPQAFASWDKDAEIVLLCKSGGRSGQAAAFLAQQGFTRAMNMTGGMIAWNAGGLPVERQ